MIYILSLLLYCIFRSPYENTVVVDKPLENYWENNINVDIR